MHDVRLSEQYLRRQLEPSAAVAFETRLLEESSLRSNLYFHRKLHHLLHIFRRKQLKSEAAAAEHTLLTEPEYSAFREEIRQIFG